MDSSSRTSASLRPMKRLMEKTVFWGLVTAWRLATVPTRRSPPLVKATTDGVVRPPSAFSMTVGSPPSSTAMQLLVVPRSIPMVLPMWFSGLLVEAKKSESHCSRSFAGVGSALPMRVAAVQLEPVVADVEANLERCAALAREALGASLVVLPEFLTTGMAFDPRLADCAVTQADGAAYLVELARSLDAMVGGSFICRDADGENRNTYLLVSPDGV